MHRPRRSRRALAGVLAAALCGALLAALPAAAATLPRPALEQPCGGTSWWAGTTDVCDGRVVYRDYVNDDEGADTGDFGYDGTQSAFGTLALPAGDVRYPDDRISSADLVRLELSRRGGVVDVVAETAALYSPTDTVLALAIDTDGRQDTGGGAWSDLGVRSKGWDRLVLLTRGDPRTNTIRGSFPLPTAKTWRVQAVTAQAATRQVMNVAFRGAQEQAQFKLDYGNPSANPPSGQGAWFEDQQAAALRSGDISAFGQRIATADLRPGVERRHRITAGLRERVYTSAYTVPAESGPPTESMSYAGVKGRGNGGTASAFAQVFNLLGKYQPYAVYVPRTTGPWGLQMEWHGSNQGITGQVNQPGMQQQFGEDLGRLLVAPEARGPNGYGSDVSERDLLDVVADVLHALPVDRSRIFSSGYSQGGYITLRMAMLYPDAFAGFTGWVPFTGNASNGTPAAGTADVTAGAVGNMADFVGNVRHVPGAMIFGGADEPVQVNTSNDLRQRFEASDDAFTWYLHPAADHFTFALLDDWRKEAAYSRDQRLVRDPGRVTYRTATFLDAPQYGIRHDSAYWVSGIRPRGDGYADTDLTSYGCGLSIPTGELGNGAGEAPVPWVSSSRTRTGASVQPKAQVLTGTLANVAALRVDLRRTCLGRAFRYDVTSDGPAVLTLSDGRTVALRSGRNQGSVG